MKFATQEWMCPWGAHVQQNMDIQNLSNTEYPTKTFKIIKLKLVVTET